MLIFEAEAPGDSPRVETISAFPFASFAPLRDAQDPRLTIIDQAMFAEDWDQAIEFSKALLIHRPENLMAKSKLAIALLISKQETQA